VSDGLGASEVGHRRGATAFLFIVPHSQVGPAPVETVREPVVVWHADPGEGIETRYYVLIAAAGVEPPNEWPGKESMNSQLVARFNLDNGEAAWIICQDVPSAPGNDVYLRNFKPHLAGDVGTEAQAAAMTPGTVLRGYLLGEAEHALRFWVDLNFAEAELWADPPSDAPGAEYAPR